MAARTLDLGPVSLIQADAVGVPGQRRFRLRVRNATDFALLWVEREQTQALALALEQVLAQLQMRRRQRDLKADPGGPLDNFPPTPTIELTVGRMGIGHDEESDLVVLELTDIEQALVDDDDDDDDDQPTPPDDITRTPPNEEERVATLIARFTRAQALALKEQCEQTLLAGRPRCPLCGAPMGADGAHMCIRANGHGGVSQGGR
jgi:uncharacterized repeat protein (TIGR03847 family)